MIPAEAGHLQGIRHEAAGFLGQVLHIPIDVVVGHQNGIPLGQQVRDLGLEPRPLARPQNRRRMLGNLLGAQAVIRQIQGRAAHRSSSAPGKPPAGQ